MRALLWIRQLLGSVVQVLSSNVFVWTSRGRTLGTVFVCLSVCLSVCLPVCLSVCLSVSLSHCLSLSLSFPFYLSVSIHLSIYLYLSQCLYLCICLSFCLSSFFSLQFCSSLLFCGCLHIRSLFDLFTSSLPLFFPKTVPFFLTFYLFPSDFIFQVTMKYRSWEKRAMRH